MEGNLQGLNPYAYVGGNPETETDPTGLWHIAYWHGHQGAGRGGWLGGLWRGFENVINLFTGIFSMAHEFNRMLNPRASGADRIWAGVKLGLNLGLGLFGFFGEGDLFRGGEEPSEAGEEGFRWGEDAFRGGRGLARRRGRLP